MPYSHWTALPAKTYLPILEQISFIIIQLDLFTPCHSSFWWQYNVFPIIFNTQYEARWLGSISTNQFTHWPTCSIPSPRDFPATHYDSPQPQFANWPPPPRPNKSITLKIYSSSSWTLIKTVFVEPSWFSNPPSHTQLPRESCSHDNTAHSISSHSLITTRLASLICGSVRNLASVSGSAPLTFWRSPTFYLCCLRFFFVCVILCISLMRHDIKERKGLEGK